MNTLLKLATPSKFNPKRKKNKITAGLNRTHDSVESGSSPIYKLMSRKPSSSNSHLLIGKRVIFVITLKPRLSWVLPGQRYCQSHCNAVFNWSSSEIGEDGNFRRKRIHYMDFKTSPRTNPHCVQWPTTLHWKIWGKKGTSTMRHLIILLLMSLGGSRLGRRWLSSLNWERKTRWCNHAPGRTRQTAPSAAHRMRARLYFHQWRFYQQG